MPLRDHFHPPFANRRSWEGFHGQWPAMIVIGLSRNLPQRYVAEPRVHLGSSIEVDVATLSVATDLLEQDEYEVRVYDTRTDRRLVAAIEIVSPANKDRPEHRRGFVTKCAALLQNHVCVVIVDLVTDRDFNLYTALMEQFGLEDASLADGSPPFYAVTCRSARQDEKWRLETWSHSLTVGQPLPTLPLWLADNFAVPLELEASYEETCGVLRIT
jgi:Protein of unknown function (DUF4058)